MDWIDRWIDRSIVVVDGQEKGWMEEEGWVSMAVVMLHNTAHTHTRSTPPPNPDPTHRTNRIHIHANVTKQVRCVLPLEGGAQLLTGGEDGTVKRCVFCPCF